MADRVFVANRHRCRPGQARKDAGLRKVELGKRDRPSPDVRVED